MIRVLIASAAMAFAGPVSAAEVSPLLQHDIAGIVGKEGSMLLVRFAPRQSDPIHRYNANVLVYVLEDAVEMQVRGRPAVTLRAGQTFYEGANDVHVVGRNASRTKSAKFLAFFIKDKSAASGPRQTSRAAASGCAA